MKQKYLFILLFLSLVPLIMLRDYTPDNELKYLSIADESIENGNIFAFYNHGVPYADKPPLYLWIVTAGRLIFGEHILFFLSLFSLIPALVTMAVMNKWIRDESTIGEQNTASMLLFTSGFYLACAVVLRMDMLMTMFIVLSLYTFYKMYQYNVKQHEYQEDEKRNKLNQKKYKRWRILFPLYIFLAVFSKGAVGVLVPVLSVLIFLAIKERSVKGYFKTAGKYLGWRTWGILGLLCGVWFMGVYLDGGSDYLNNLLFHQTINRAVDAFHHKKPIWYYAVTYWYAIAPWSLLVCLVLGWGVVKKLIKTNIEILFATVTFSTLVMMSLISSKLVVYLLPCFPFMIYLTILLLPKVKNNSFIKAGVVIPSVVLILPFIAAVVLELLPDGNQTFAALLTPYKEFTHLFPLPVYLPTAILAAGGVAAICFIKKGIGCSIKILSGSILLLIFVVSPFLPAFNNIIGLDGGCKKAFEMASETKAENGSVSKKSLEIAFYDFKAGMNLDVYFKKYMQQSGHYTKDEIKNFEMRKLVKEELDTVSNVVMFVKEKDFSRDSVLNAAMGQFPRYTFGAFSLVTVKR